MTARRRVFFFLALAGAACLRAQETAVPAVAAPPAAPASGEAQPASPGGNASTGPKITINGYLNQAYAISDGNQYLGIPSSGTADYRTAAVQMRVDLTAADSFACKLRNERIGKSPAQSFEADVALDWLFYEHKFGAGSGKVGRVKIPFGVYNEVRDVGTLLPFYRPADDFYGLGSFTTQAINGLALSYSFDLGAGWTLDSDAYGGNWEFLSITSEVGLVKSRARNTVGVELWLGTPVRGLRIGAGGMRYKVETDGIPNERADLEHVSLEWEMGRVVAHVEYKLRRSADARDEGGYAHLGVRLTPKLGAHAQYQVRTLDIKEFPLGLIHLDKDRALGLDYAFRRDLVLKVEGHWNKGFQVDTPGGIPNFFVPARSTRYAILSLSVSF